MILPCKKCQIKCCHPPIFLGRIDIERLKKAGKIFEFKRAKIAGFDLVSKGKCPFIEDGVGCTLEDIGKPIDCTLFPLTFKEKESGKFDFRLNNYCPLANNFPEDWIIETKKWARKHLKEWTKLERKAYLERQK